MLTPEQARDLAEWAGSISAAAREVCVANSTFHVWLNPEANRARSRRWYAANAEHKREYAREQYASLDAVQYGRRRLVDRRTKALHRGAERHQRRQP